MNTLLMSSALTKLSASLHTQESRTKVRAVVHVQSAEKRPRFLRSTAKMMVIQSTVKSIDPVAQRCAEELIVVQRTLMALDEVPEALPQGKHFRWPKQMHPMTLASGATYSVAALRAAEAEKIRQLNEDSVFVELPVLRVVGPTTVAPTGKEVYIPRDVFPGEDQVAIEDVLVLELNFHHKTDDLTNPMSWELGKPVLATRDSKIRNYERVATGQGMPALTNVTGKTLALVAMACADIGNNAIKALLWGFRHELQWRNGADPAPSDIITLVQAMREIEDMPEALDKTLEDIQRQAKLVAPGRRAWLQEVLRNVCLGDDYPADVSLKHRALAEMVEAVLETMTDETSEKSGADRLLQMMPLFAYQGFAEGFAEDVSVDAWMRALVGANPFAPVVADRIRVFGGEAAVEAPSQVAETASEEVSVEVTAEVSDQDAEAGDLHLGDPGFYVGRRELSDEAFADFAPTIDNVLAEALAKADTAMLWLAEPEPECVEELADAGMSNG